MSSIVGVTVGGTGNSTAGRQTDRQTAEGQVVGSMDSADRLRFAILLAVVAPLPLLAPTYVLATSSSEPSAQVALLPPAAVAGEQTSV